MSVPPTILVFDSGLGGLTVLREIVKRRPDAHYVYVADDAFFPYGHHSEDEIIARVVPLVGELIARHAPDLVVIACNTMSGSVMAHLRAPISVPFVGTVPAIKPACASIENQARVGARHQGHRQARIHPGPDPRYGQGCEVTLVGSAELASLAEAALSGNDVSDEDILPNSRPALSARKAIPREPTRWCWPARIIRCCSTGWSGWRPGRWTGSIRRRRSPGAWWICSAHPGSESRRGRRRDDFHLETAAHAEPGVDAVFRRPRSGLVERRGRPKPTPS